MNIYYESYTRKLVRNGLNFSYSKRFYKKNVVVKLVDKHIPKNY